VKTVAIVIARIGSTRLRGKVLMSLGGGVVLDWVTGSAYSIPGVNEVWIATSTLEQDNVIEEWCKKKSIKCFRGSETDVLSRFTGAAIAAEADVVIRLTGDCPFIDPRVVGEVAALREATGADYASNIDPPTWPDGLDCEVMTVKALKEANEKATRPSDRNTVTQYILRNRMRYKIVNLTCPLPDMHKERWVLDTQDDYHLCQILAEKCLDFSYLGIKRFLDKNPEYRNLNKYHPRNERFWDELVVEEPVKREHTVSHAMLGVTERLIPLGTQTYSKSKLQYPVESPLFVTHGSGGHVYDVDGNDYVDLVGGLLPVILGHRDPDVDRAIRMQLDRGISFSLATDLEHKLAEKLNRYIPCAEMARFGKNGTDVTSAAVRLARAMTGRDHILSAGYHGWMDWAIARDPVRNIGVPEGIRDFTTVMRHGDITFAEKALVTKRFACVIVEPETDPEFLARLRVLCNLTGTLLIFDEIITGFRFGLGGAQKVWGVTPDLATFGKAMGNGMPISALVGKKKYMKLMDQVCFSGTFFGETLSLAASLAVIEKMEREPVHDALMAKNREISTLVSFMQEKHGIHCLRITGSYFSRVNFIAVGMNTAEDIKTLYMQEMIKNGVLIIASHNFMYAHNEADMRRIVNAYDRTLGVIKKAVAEDKVKSDIVGPSIAATASVRVS